MRKLAVLFFILISAVSFGQTEKETSELTFEQIKDDSWMDSSFLTKRFNFLPALQENAGRLGLTEEQKKIINDFYSKYYNRMVELAKSVREKEKQLQELVINGGDSKRIKELIIEIAKEKAELTVYNIKEVRTLQSALTKEQFEKLKNLASQRII
ncbi:MAG: Spy/CpxP family protein refolding chaperone [Persephonella sp.]|nr:Spy/CpxP family protein refolding chaperone [Persephonella sp.]